MKRIAAMRINAKKIAVALLAFLLLYLGVPCPAPAAADRPATPFTLRARPVEDQDVCCVQTERAQYRAPTICRRFSPIADDTRADSLRLSAARRPDACAGDRMPDLGSYCRNCYQVFHPVSSAG